MTITPSLFSVGSAYVAAKNKAPAGAEFRFRDLANEQILTLPKFQNFGKVDSKNR